MLLIFYYLLLTVFIIATLIFLFLLYIGSSKTPPNSSDSPTYYHKSNTPLYSLSLPPKVTLTVVIPAYNEATRLPKMLTETLGFLRQYQKKKSNFQFEILVVCDGSSDDTAGIALAFKRENDMDNHELNAISMSINRGKGAAVASGMLHSKGEYLLFADADGATKFDDIERLFESLNKISIDDMAVVVGSRHHLKTSAAVVNRSPFRNFLMNGFHLYLHILGIREIRDTQCGFKLFTRHAARILFSNLHIRGWVFDIELLLLASRFNIPVSEVAVNWVEIEGSKVNVIRDAIGMAWDLLVIRASYAAGVWKITNPGRPHGETLNRLE